MNSLNQLSIRVRLLLIFGMTTLIFTAFGFYAIREMGVLTSATRTLYDHPLHVSNAALRAGLGFIKMQRDMRSLAISEYESDIQEYFQAILNEEAGVHAQLDIVRNRILGEEGKKLEREVREQFSKWKSERREIVELSLKGDQKSALMTVRKKSAEAGGMLEHRLLELAAYARNKADGFMRDAESAQSRIVRNTLIFIVLSAMFSLFIIVLTGRSILMGISALKNTMSEISHSGKPVRSELKGNNEITEMAGHFNRLIDILQEQLWLRNGLNLLNEKISGRMSFEEMVSESISFVSRYAEACTGAIFTFHPEEEMCRLRASFAFTERKYLAHAFKKGEGVVGQVAVEKSPILLKNISREEAVTNTGTQSEAPKNIYTFPLLYEGQLYGVAETAFFEEMTQIRGEFLDSAAKIIATALYTSDQSEKIRNLLDESKASNVALQRKTAQLSEANENLTGLNDELKAQSDELQAQAQELEAQKHELEMQRLRVEEADRLKSEFLSNMSHELRTPLNSVLALSQLLIDRGTGRDTEQEKEFLRVIERNGRQLLNLINDILDLSKIEAGRMELYLTDFTPRQVTQRALETIGPLAREKGLEIQTEIADEPLLHTDEEKLHQILLNLLSNAVKFTAQGSIRVKTDVSGSMIFFAVSDDGIGIPASELERIFDEFRQVDGSTTRAYGGTGLGLSICRKLARLLDGDIQVESEPGKGSTFTLVIPLQISRDKSVNPKPVPDDSRQDPSERKILSFQSPARKKGKTVVIIDDDAEVCSLIGQYLKEAGYQSITAQNGREGLKLAREIRPFAITLDILMPGLDGWEVLRELKSSEKTEHIPVIVISVSEDRKTGIMMGAAAYITKPFERNLLLAEIRKLESVREVHRILAVDDDPIVLMQLEEVLGEKGYEVETASDGKEALALALAHPPDVMILDLMMPETDGFAVLDQIRREPGTRDLPVIILTAKDLSRAELMHLEETVHHIITKKMMDREELRRSLHNALENIRTSDPKDSPLILLVEDNEVAAIQIRSVLEEREYRVYTVCNGTEAVEYLNRQIPDAMILDLMMPGMDGFQVLAQIRSVPETSELPVLVLTSKELSAQDRVQLHHNHVCQLIQKGAADREQLGRCVENLLKKEKVTDIFPVDSATSGRSLSGKKEAKIPKPHSETPPLLLVAEDNPDNLLTVTAILEGFGYASVAAANGREVARWWWETPAGSHS
ncbi:MAG: response regulator [Desulfobacterales bacterium]